MEFKKIIDVVNISRGDRLTKTQLQENEEKNYLFYGGGINPMGYWKDFNTDKNTVTVINYGTAGFVGYTKEKIWAGDVLFRIVPKANDLDSKFLYFALLNQQEQIYKKVRGSIPCLSTDNLENLIIPLPPLNQQQKIAHLLTNFENAIKQLFSLLEREKELRQKQYSFYLKKLFGLFFKNFSNVNFRDTGKLLRGKAINSKLLEKELKPNQNFPFLNGGFKPSGYWNSWSVDFETFTISTGGVYAGFINYWKEKIWVGSDCLYFVPQNQNFLLKYIYYFLKFKQDVLLNNKRGAAMPHLNKDILNNFQIPLLPLNQQKTVTKNLTILETSTEKMKADVTAEIELRKQQYKHYLNTIFQHLI